MPAVFLVSICSLFHFYRSLVRFISLCMCMFVCTHARACVFLCACWCIWTCIHNQRLTLGISLTHSLSYYLKILTFLTIVKLCVYIRACKWQVLVKVRSTGNPGAGVESSYMDDGNQIQASGRTGNGLKGWAISPAHLHLNFWERIFCWI